CFFVSTLTQTELIQQNIAFPSFGQVKPGKSIKKTKAQLNLEKQKQLANNNNNINQTSSNKKSNNKVIIHNNRPASAVKINNVNNVNISLPFQLNQALNSDQQSSINSILSHSQQPHNKSNDPINPSQFNSQLNIIKQIGATNNNPLIQNLVQNQPSVNNQSST